MVKAASCLDDGSMKQFLTDWYNWTEEGWCEIPALENASSAMQEDFYNGNLVLSFPVQTVQLLFLKKSGCWN